MMTSLHRCIIVPADHAPTARALCNGMGLQGSGSNMFIVALSASGSLPASHFISAGLLGADFCALMPLTSFDPAGAAATAPGQPDTIVYLAGKAGLAVTRDQVTTLLTSVEVTQENWQTALTRRGLQNIHAVLA